jgi:signal transduction histidine kinase
VDLLATIATAACAVELFSAALSASGYWRRPAGDGRGLIAILCLASGAHAMGSIALSEGPSHGAAVAAALTGWLGLVLALPAALGFTLGHAGLRGARRASGLLYAASGACALLDVVAARYSPTLQTPTGSLGLRATVPGFFGLATHVEAVVVSVAIIAIAARAYASKQRDAMALAIGGAMLLATALHDLGIVDGLWTSKGFLIDAGLGMFVAGVMGTQAVRFASVTRELERRTQDLRTRTGELRRSYEELRAAQEELVKKEQLAVVGELAAVIAHEVRNPLAIIANAGAGLRKQAISRQDHETLLAILDEETSRLNRLVTDLLRYARPVNVQRSDFSLADVLARALGLVSKDRASIATELLLEGHDGRIWGDSNLLRQVFDNLVVNAVQAMGGTGTLTVRVREATQEGIDGVAIDIIDTGEGMDTQVRSRARDPFFTTRPSGTGLGLAIVDRIVDAHGGYLTIDSRSGEGTTVTVFLPAWSPNEPEVRRGRPSKAPPQAQGPAGATG